MLRKIVVRFGQLAYDLVYEAGLAGGVLYPVCQLGWFALDLLDDTEAERVERGDAAF
jgi:hypothetical protein